MQSRAILARNLRTLRKDRGWSQERLAFEAQLDRTYVSGIERRTRNPTIDVLDALGEALGVKSWRLLCPSKDWGDDQAL
jgi:transcriptional regulator with XRE-family HTH domain